MFWRLQPNKSCVVKGNKVAYAVQSKERVMGLVFGSMLGEKFKLAVIGKNEHPRNWQNIYQLPINYYWNGSAWMTRRRDILKTLSNL